MWLGHTTSLAMVTTSYLIVLPWAVGHKSNFLIGPGQPTKGKRVDQPQTDTGTRDFIRLSDKRRYKLEKGSNLGLTSLS